MKVLRLLGIAAVFFCLALPNAVFAADKVIVSYSSRSYAFLPAQVAVARGFLKMRISNRC